MPMTTPDPATASCHRTAALPRMPSNLAKLRRLSIAHPSGPKSHTGDSTATPLSAPAACAAAGIAAK